MYTLVTGDKCLLLVTLKVGAAAQDLTDLNIKARLKSKNDSAALTETITCQNSWPGAEWANGVVAVVIPAASTADIDATQHPEVVLEIQVDDGGYQKTWFVPVEVANGTID